MPALPKPSEDPPIGDVPIPCMHCERSIIVPADQMPPCENVGDLFAVLWPVADAHGWGYGQAWMSNGAMPELSNVFVCPVCLKKPEEAMTRVLPKFKEDRHCPACDHDDVSTKHCRGTILSCELGAPRNHLHRTCKRCGWSWIEGRLDEVQPVPATEYADV